MNSAKIALVTGGSRGLGKDMAIALAKKGNDVILTYHQNHDMAKDVVSVIEGLGRKAAAIRFVGSVVAFVCSEEARWINGQRIEVSGGINL